MRRRYLNQNSTARHFIEDMLFGDRGAISLCGVAPRLFADIDDWLGTGNQTESDKLDSLPDCKNCTKVLERNAK
jgi:hypothetical protein